MFSVYWGDSDLGRLTRRAFLGWFLLLTLIQAVVAFGLGVAITTAERMLDIELLEAQLPLRDSLGLMGILFVSAIFLLLLLGQLNIMVKRVRDMGLPNPWLIMLAWLPLAWILNFSGAEVALGGVFSLALFVVLLLVPSGASGQDSARRYRP
jgi:uncharacterized membrane protein YhaH (DUF805 family)